MRNNDSPVKNVMQGKMIVAVVLGTMVIFAMGVGLALNFIGTHLVEQSNAQYSIVAENVAEEITTWFSNVSQIVTNQKASIEIRDDFDSQNLTEYLTRIVDNYNEDGYIYDLYFTNTNNVMSSGYGYVPDSSIDFRERDWYKDAVEKNGICYSSPYKDTNLDRYVVTISTPCFNKAGEFQGVLALDIFVDTLFSIARDKVIDGNSYVFLIDNDLDIVTHPNEDFSYIDEEPMQVAAIEGNLYKMVVEQIREINIAGENTTHNSIKDYDGVSRTIYASKIECCGWYVIAAIDSSVYYMPLLKTIIIVILALVFCLAVGIISTRLITSRIINQLNEANENALIANEAKSTFLANMSHEIRTPINAIIGMNEMILRENADPVIKEYSADIASASRSLVTIVNDVLDFSKIESGKMEIIENEFNIGSIVNDIVNMSESRLGGRNLKLLFDIDPELPRGIIGDEMRIKQVILNLVTNAIKYTDTGFVALKINFTKQSYGINLNVSVRDSGIGISEENMGQLFQSFERFDTKRNRAIEGTGLGLSITKRLVQNMNGFINVYSKLGEGSEFTVCLPLKVTDENPFITVENAEKMKFVVFADRKRWNKQMIIEMNKIVQRIGKGLKFDMVMINSFEELTKTIEEQTDITHVITERLSLFDNQSYYEKLSKDKKVLILQKKGNADILPDGIIPVITPFYSISFAAVLNSTKKSDYVASKDLLGFEAPDVHVLVVDDNTMNLKVASGLLKPYKVKVTTADSGIEALEILDKTRDFTMVFMDHMMPGMDGVETTAMIRKLEGDYFKNLPIIALTANSTNNARNMFLSSGFDNFIAKPISVASLESILKQYIPEDKITFIKHSEDNGEQDSSVSEAKTEEVKSVKAKSRDGDFDYKLGLKYAANDMDLYFEILSEYVLQAEEMFETLQNSYTNEDWDTYVIKVHALKSTSMTIGAANLSKVAKELEYSGKAKDYSPIHEKHADMLELYKTVLADAESYLKENGIEVNKKDEAPVNLSEIAVDQETVIEFVEAFRSALSELDVDMAEEVYSNASAEGEEYEKLFETTMKYIRDFEYDNAENELERIQQYEKDSDN